MQVITIIAMLAVSFAGFATHEQDVAAIKAMQGCYQVTYQNAETFAVAPEYKEYADRFKSGGLEWIFVDEESEHQDYISLQHLLIVAPNTIVKHWRQEWRHADFTMFTFEGNNTFKYRSTLPQPGVWTQQVLQVDDSPRYECAAPWVHWTSASQSRNYWECESNAPLPRREFSVRDDYNILVRRNRHEINSTGHAHTHDGKKLLRTTDADKILVEEKGKNTYVKVDDKLCNDAVQWWQTHERFWRDVRFVWNKIFDEDQDLVFKSVVNGEKLWQRLFTLDAASANDQSYDSQMMRALVEDEIRRFLK